MLKYFGIIFTIFLISLLCSFWVSCLRYERIWVVTYDVDLKKFLLQSGLIGSTFNFPDFIPDNIISIISKPADEIRMYMISDSRASEQEINKSKLKEFIKEIGTKDYNLITSPLSGHKGITIFAGNKINFGCDIYKYDSSVGFKFDRKM